MRLIFVVYRNGTDHCDRSIGCYGMTGQESDIYEHLLWVEHFLYIIILKTPIATFEVGTIIPVLQETEEWLGEVTCE